MNILTVLCGGGWMPAHLSEGWRRVGWTVTEFLYGTHMGKSWSREGVQENLDVNARLLETARRLRREGRLDLVFAAIYDDILTVETAIALRRLGVPLVNYHVDLVGQWYRVLRTGKYFDLVACAHRDHWVALRRAGIRPYYMPMAANPGDAIDLAAIPRFDDVLYLGSPTDHRLAVLGELARRRIPLRIYGHGWDTQERNSMAAGKPDPSKAQPMVKNVHDLRHYLIARMREEGVTGVAESILRRMDRPSHAATPGMVPKDSVIGVYSASDFAALVRGAAVNLGFTYFKGKAGSAGERRQLRLREFEVTMAGGFYLTQDCPQLRELFRVGEEIETWDGVDELEEKVRHYIAHPQERERIAAAGYSRTAHEHTWEHRFRGLLSELRIGAGKPAAPPAGAS